GAEISDERLAPQVVPFDNELAEIVPVEFRRRIFQTLAIEGDFAVPPCQRAIDVPRSLHHLDRRLRIGNETLRSCLDPPALALSADDPDLHHAFGDEDVRTVFPPADREGGSDRLHPDVARLDHEGTGLVVRDL